MAFLHLHDSASGELVGHVAIAPGETVYEALDRSSFGIQTSCRGSTICGKCAVTVMDPPEALTPLWPDEQILLDRFAQGSAGMRLACRIELPEGAEVLKVATPYWRRSA